MTKDSSPLNPVDSLASRICQTDSWNEVTLPALSEPVISKKKDPEQVTSRMQWEGEIPREAEAGGNASDMLTRGREIGREKCQ